jgi:hypothetical protein
MEGLVMRTDGHWAFDKLVSNEKNKYLRGFILSSCFLLLSFPVQASETPPIQFAQEYIRELGVLEDLRSEAAADMKEKSANKLQPFIIGIHSFTRMQNAIRTNVYVLKKMQLSPPNESDIKSLTDIYEVQIEIYRRMISISTEIISGPKPNVDYGALMADMPKLRADLEDTNQSLFQMANLVFAMLIDMRPDKNNHASHLVITRDERQALIDSLNRRFGSKLDKKDQNYIVSGAWLLRANLQKDFKCSDDPW